MRYVRYDDGGSVRHGLLKDATISPIQGSLFGDHQLEEAGVRLDQVRLLAPVQPTTVYAIGLNYQKHIEEFKHIDETRDTPQAPITFMCAPSALLGPDDEIVLDSPGDPIHFEAELVVVIGKEADGVTEAEALDYVFGYTIGNDVSNRAQQQKDKQWFRAKSHPTYKPLGPWIETDLDPASLSIRSWINGDLRQDGTTADLIFSVPKLIAHISSITPLQPGDIIYTGTPDGVGPLAPGDAITMEIQGIGRLHNKVAMG